MKRFRTVLGLVGVVGLLVRGAVAMTQAQWQAEWAAATNGALKDACVAKMGEVEPALSAETVASVTMGADKANGRWQALWDQAAKRKEMWNLSYAAAQLRKSIGDVLAVAGGDAAKIAAGKYWLGYYGGNPALRGEGAAETYRLDPSWGRAVLGLNLKALTALEVLNSPPPVRTKDDAENAQKVWVQLDRSGLTRDQYKTILDKLLIQTDVIPETAALVGLLKSNSEAVK